MKVRGKFVVTQVTKFAGTNYAKVEMEPRYDSKLPEDQRFAEATPSGKLELGVTVPSVVEFFTPGKVLYLDFSEAPVGTSTLHE